MYFYILCVTAIITISFLICLTITMRAMTIWLLNYFVKFFFPVKANVWNLTLYAVMFNRVLLEVLRPDPRILTFLFWREGIWNRKGMEGRFRCLSRRSTRYDVSRASNTRVSSHRCGSAYHMVAMTPSGTVRSSVL